MESKEDIFAILEKTNYELSKWNELVEFKRKVSNQIRETSEIIVDIKENKIKKLNSQIHQLKMELDEHVFKYRNTKDEISQENDELKKNSEEVAKIKNMLSILESRIVNDTEEELHNKVEKYHQTIDKNEYNGENEKNNILTLIKEENMKIEAIRVVKNLKENLVKLNSQSENLQKKIRIKNAQMKEFDSKIKKIKDEIFTLYSDRSKLNQECEEKIKIQNSFFLHLEKINKRLDVLSKIRKEIGNFGKGVNNQEIINVIDNAKKKLEKGSKMTLDELKLAYNDKIN